MKEEKSNATGISRKANKELHGHGQLPSEGQTIVAESKGVAVGHAESSGRLELQQLAGLSKDGLDSIRSTVNELIMALGKVDAY